MRDESDSWFSRISWKSVEFTDTMKKCSTMNNRSIDEIWNIYIDWIDDRIVGDSILLLNCRVVKKEIV